MLPVPPAPPAEVAPPELGVPPVEILPPVFGAPPVSVPPEAMPPAPIPPIPKAPPVPLPPPVAAIPPVAFGAPVLPPSQMAPSVARDPPALTLPPVPVEWGSPSELVQAAISAGRAKAQAVFARRVCMQRILATTAPEEKSADRVRRAWLCARARKAEAFQRAQDNGSQTWRKPSPRAPGHRDSLWRNLDVPPLGR